MTGNKERKTVLMIGAGPMMVGQSGEYDHATLQACKTLRALGCKVILADSNPDAVSPDAGEADVVYLIPLDIANIRKVIEKERPDALLPVCGGQTAMNLAADLLKAGILHDLGIALLGVDQDALLLREDRAAFIDTLTRIGIELPRSRTVGSLEEAGAALQSTGLPVVIHPVAAFGGTAGALVYNMEEFRAEVLRGLSASSVNQVMVEESVRGWRELELVVVRDAAGKALVAGEIENIDPMGIHTGDSACVIPMQTVDAALRQKLTDIACKVASAVELVGCATIQFGYDPDSGRIVVIEINIRTSRSSTLVERATGFPVAAVAAGLAAGQSLDACLPFMPAPPTWITVKLPHFDIDRIEGAQDILGTQMRSTGEVVGLGGTFKEALQKAVQALKPQNGGLGADEALAQMSSSSLKNLLAVPSSRRYFGIYEALKRGLDSSQLAKTTGIDPWFVQQMREIVDLEAEIRSSAAAGLPEALLGKAKKDGFGDAQLACLIGCASEDILDQRRRLNLYPAVCALPGSQTHGDGLFYTTYHVSSGVFSSDKAAKGVLFAGGGAYRIGQGSGFDHGLNRAMAALRQCGYVSLLLNANPAAASMDPAPGHRVYLVPVSLEHVMDIVNQEAPQATVLQFGGKAALSLAAALEAQDVPLWGTRSASVALIGDRLRFKEFLASLAIPQPEFGLAETPEQLRALATRIGFPILIRPRRPDGNKVAIIRDLDGLSTYLQNLTVSSVPWALVVDRFLDNAVEAEADVLVADKAAWVPAVMEHIELAGIHSADSACVIPPISIAPRHVETIGAYARKIAQELKIAGLMNIECAITGNTVYVLGVYAGHSRTVPLVSKVCGMPLADLAARVLSGQGLDLPDMAENRPPHCGVKHPVFPFGLFPEADPLLGPETHATGSVLGLAEGFGMAMYRSLEAAHLSPPLQGALLITVADRDKTSVIEPARLFMDLGFKIRATEGTHRFLTAHGITAEPIRKLGYGRPDIVDAIKNNEIQLVINTPCESDSQVDDSYIRKTADRHGVVYFTTTAAALAAAKGIAARKTGSAAIWPFAMRS